MAIHEIDTWTNFKALVITKKDLPLQYKVLSRTSGDMYEIWAIETLNNYIVRIDKEGTAPDPSDQKDFEDNYKTSANKTISQIRSTFTLGEYRFRGNGASGTCSAGSTSEIDYTMMETRRLSGGEVVVTGAQIFDWVKFQVVAANGTTVLDEYVEKWHINPTSGSGSIFMTYAGEVQINWILRLIYNADAAGSTRSFGINYFLHKPIS